MTLSLIINRLGSACRIRCIGNVEGIKISGVTEYSPSATKDTVFVAMRGEEKNGEDYINDARARGCSVFVCERMIRIREGEVLIVVGNARLALAVISKTLWGAHLNEMKAIAVTGTKGKTTTARMLGALLSEAAVPYISIGTLGCEICADGREVRKTANTTPSAPYVYKALAQAHSRGIRAAIIEASSQALKQYRLFGIPFFGAIFTNLSHDHIGKGEHESFYKYFLAKRSLFTDYGVEVAIVNAADPYAARMAHGVKKTIKIGTGVLTDYRITEPYISGGVSFSLFGERYEIGMKGGFNIENAALALGAAKECFGIAPSSMKYALRNFSVDGRYEEYRIGKKRIIIDFAHNPDSFLAIMESVLAETEGRLISVFGSVGGRSRARRMALSAIAERFCDISIITSDNPDREPPEQIASDILKGFSHPERAQVVIDRKEAVKRAVDIARAGDTVLLLGKGHEDYQLVMGRRIPFSERDIIEALGARRITSEQAPAQADEGGGA